MTMRWYEYLSVGCACVCALVALRVYTNIINTEVFPVKCMPEVREAPYQIVRRIST